MNDEHGSCREFLREERWNEKELHAELMNSIFEK
jgi:hypothetical protein